MAMAGRGLHAAPPPRPPHHDHFGQPGSNPGNQLYVGNVGCQLFHTVIVAEPSLSYHTRLVGRI